MRKWVVGWLLLAAPAALFAQITPVERIEEARASVSTAENALDRAREALDRSLEALRASSRAEGAEGKHAQHAMPPPVAAQRLTVRDIEPMARLSLDSLTRRYRVPGSNAPDSLGAFRLVCNMAHLSYNDPIVYPGQPGKSHLHMFFGNTETDENSTYASLRASGGGTCQGDVLNRSAYWIPALLDGSGMVVVPDYVGLYYKRRPATDPECERAAVGDNGRCAGIPAGLRAIFGTNYVQDHRESPHVRFDCGAGFDGPSLSAIVDECRGKPVLYARIEAPDCWDGVNLDSEDHQSHLAYMFYDGRRRTPRCPATHPVVIPKLSLIVAYAMLPDDRPETWIFSSDAMVGAEPGTTFHSDYMEAWEPAARLAWEAACLDKLLNCSAGDLGDGRIMKEPRGFTFEQRPHLVAAPARD